MIFRPIFQVCNAVYVRLNYTQPLCACPARYRDPCSASLNADDLHTTRLTTDSKKKVQNEWNVQDNVGGIKISCKGWKDLGNDEMNDII